LACKDISVQHYVNGRIDIERSKGTHTSLNHGKLAVEAAKAVESDPVGQSHGKTILKWVRNEYQKEYLSHLQDTVPTAHLSVDSLETIAKKTFRTQSKQTT
jgi:hypothetical protein